MRTLKLTIAYDGTNYAGWQFQPDRVTVQETLENAVAQVTGQRVRVLASGRTDAGVHALEQVVGLRTDSTLPPETLRRALNANLPDDVAVLDVAEAPADFHAIAQVRRKRYRYVIHDGPVRRVFARHYAWHYVYGRLDAGAMHRAAGALLGTHDFRSFETAELADGIRTIFDIFVRRGRAGQGGDGELGIGDWGLGSAKELLGDCPNFRPTKMGLSPSESRQLLIRQSLGIGDWGLGKQGSPESDDFIVIEVEADGFLYNMVRAIVGTLVEVGRGRRPESWPGEVLLAMNRRVAGPTAPPQGLFLVRVEY